MGFWHVPISDIDATIDNIYEKYRSHTALRTPKVEGTTKKPFFLHKPRQTLFVQNFDDCMQVIQQYCSYHHGKSSSCSQLVAYLPVLFLSSVGEVKPYISKRKCQLLQC